jgi:D-glycero-D-manno-heptose 1,7-bisphosphate phosphatase
MNKAIFLDRDGVINKEVNYLYKIADFEFIDGVIEALKYFQNNGYILIVVTNQSGIGRGYYDRDDFLILNSWMLSTLEEHGVFIKKVFYCPTAPEGKDMRNDEDRGEDNCRKPSPNMLLKAKKEFDINMENSYMIGDKEIDIEAGINAKVKKTVLVKSGHKPTDKELENTKATFVADDLKDAMQYIEV